MSPWVDWAKQIQAIAQIGKTYTKDGYDLERYGQLEVIAHQMMAALAEAPLGRVQNFFVPEKGYATPKVDLRGVVFSGDRVLLVRERSDHGWTLPGGWADIGESPRTGVVREVFEESGYRVTNPRLAAVVDRGCHPYRPERPDHIYKLFFLCELEGGAPAANMEISDVAFFPVSDLPPLSIDRTLPQDIQRVWEFHVKAGSTVYVD